MLVLTLLVLAGGGTTREVGHGCALPHSATPRPQSALFMTYRCRGGRGANPDISIGKLKATFGRLGLRCSGSKAKQSTNKEPSKSGMNIVLLNSKPDIMERGQQMPCLAINSVWTVVSGDRINLVPSLGTPCPLCPRRMGLDRGAPPPGFALADTPPGEGAISGWGSGTIAITSATHLELRWVRCCVASRTSLRTCGPGPVV